MVDLFSYPIMHACVGRFIHGDRRMHMHHGDWSRGRREDDDGMMNGVNHSSSPLCASSLLGVRAAGLKRTGKSCRLRWVNYLHPGLRRGRITADEERLILELHAQWGSRWSRIARSLPGRTDNEIKNFWRTRTRKKALEQRRQMNNNDKMMAAASPSSSSMTSGISSGSPNSADSSSPVTESALLQERSGGDHEAELEEASMRHQHQQEHCYTMDQLWNEIAAAEAAAATGYVASSWESDHHHGGAAVELPSMPSPVWEFCADYSLWRIDDEEYYKMMLDAS